MSQVRIMEDDPEYGQAVVDAIRRALQASPELTIGSVTRLSHRGGGLRVVFDASLAQDPPSRAHNGPLWADAERVDQSPQLPGRRALPSP